MTDVLIALGEILEQRKQVGADDSYVASLYAKGINKILEKVGEEATETIIAAKDAAAGLGTEAVVSETADLWFHSLVMLAHLGESPASVLKELERRFDISGHDEKAARGKS